MSSALLRRTVALADLLRLWPGFDATCAESRLLCTISLSSGSTRTENLGGMSVSLYLAEDEFPIAAQD